MGWGAIVFHRETNPNDPYDHSGDVEYETTRATLNVILDTMELQKPDDEVWCGRIAAIRGIKMLYVGEQKDQLKDWTDFGFGFFNALSTLKKSGPPEYYQGAALEQFVNDIDTMKQMFQSHRNLDA